MDKQTYLWRVQEHLGTLAPIKSIRVDVFEDRSTWVIRFKAGATEQQKAAAQAAMLVFDPPPDDPEDMDSKAFTKREQAILVAAALLGGANPAQAKAQAKARFKQAMQLV